MSAREEAHCSADCSKLRGVLRKWPSEKPRAAFYYLANRLRSGWLINALQHLKKNFNSEYKYPVILFHEPDFTERQKHLIRSCVNDSIFFQEVKMKVSSYLTRPVPKDIHCGGKSVGYKNMCRFQAKTVYEQPIIQGFDYLFRMDDDSILTYPVEFDIFKYMNSHNLVYGYRGIASEKHQCVKGLWEAATHYINKHNIQTQFFNSWHHGRIYYNNFEISKSDLWLSRKYREFMDYIDKLGGIYYHRWGDAPIKSIAVSMFVPLNRTHHFGNVPYQHGTFVPVVTDTDRKLQDTDRVELYMQNGLSKVLLNYTWHC